MRRVLSKKAMRQRLRRQVAWGRVSLLAMVVMTLLNLLMLALGVEYHFLFSAAVPYYLNWSVRNLGVGGAAPMLTGVLGLGICGGYLACCELSRRRRGWLAPALGGYVVDTLALTVFAAVLLQNPAACFLEILTHICWIGILTMGVWAEAQLRQMMRKDHTRKKTGTF